MKKKLLLLVVSVFLFAFPSTNFGQAPTLGTTTSFALFTAAGAFNNTGATQVIGDIGTNVGAFTGFPPGTVVGQIQVTNPASVQAAIDVDVAYSSFSGITCGSVIGTTLGNNQVLPPDVYCIGAATVLNGDLILDGLNNPNSIFVFKIDGALSTNTFSNVRLINLASLCNVYWQINGGFSLGENSVFRGTIVVNGAIALLDASTLLGRGLSRAGAISLHNNVVTLGTQATASTITANGATTFCIGGSVTLSGNVNGIWSNGETTSSITVTTSGDYFVTNASSCGNINSNIITVTEIPAPSCIITGSNTICPGGTTSLCAPATTGNTYLWSTGATTSCISVSAAGTYSVVVTNNGCTSTCSITVTLATLSCIITGSNTICPGGTTSLCAPATTGNTYLWSTGATTSCISVSAAGTYSVVVTNNGCTSTCSITVTISTPSCIITGSGTLCPGGTIPLCAPTAAGNSYLWSTGETTNCISVTAIGTYSVTVSNNGCSSTCSKTVITTIPPTCYITGNNIICQGGSTTLCAHSATGNTYLWSTGATTNCISVNAAGIYSVIVSNSGCSSTCTVTVTEIPAPSCVITGSNTICMGGTTSLCAPAATGNTYIWSTGETTNCITVSAAGNYSVLVTNNGCTSTCNVTVTMTTLSCNIIGSTIICPGGTTTLCAPLTTGSSYLWSNGETTNCISVGVAGTYSVTLTNNGCSSTCSITVTVSIPDCTITGNSSFCAGGSTSLCAPYIAGAIYLWNTGETTNCINVITAGTYSVTVSNIAGCSSCSSTCSKTVTVNPPSCVITGNNVICQGGSTSLCAPFEIGNNYLWSTGSTNACINVSTAGTYSVTVTNNGCSSTCSISVTVIANPICSITGNLNPDLGDSTTLCAPAGMASYLWSTCETTNCIIVSASGIYTLTVTNSGGCTSTCNVTVLYNTFSDGLDELSSPAVFGNIEVRDFPNPFNSKAIIEFQNTKLNSHITIQLFNLTGNNIATLFDKDVAKGMLNTVEINGENLANGIYIYRMTIDDQIINRKIILAK